MRPQDFDLDLVRAFVAVADTRNFTQAAARLHRTQSAVSMKIKRLEESIGERLFERDTVAVTLTSIGERFVGIAQRLIEAHEDAFLSLKHSLAAGKLTLATSETFASCLLPPILGAIGTTFPNIEMEIRCGHSWKMLESMETENIDLVIATKYPSRPDGVPLGHERLMWVCKQGSDVYQQKPVPLAVFPDGCLYRRAGIAALDAKKKDWRIAYTSLNHEGLLAAVEAGSAVSIMIESAVTEHHRVLEPSDGFPTLEPTAIELYSRRSDVSPVVRNVSEIIHKHFAARLCERKVSTIQSLTAPAIIE
ncbi:LysR family transcriptional regulator [Caballeronia sp. LP006]|uniref:LysR family transcriptional regulator n=1 Tax=Caballeronia sp. LP006 TaxID=3038552 RepID=UPI002859C37B|nr:LysR family transcriptional regulator [Caballeronia sp. LP006]MDR5826459.1 LysR family transcriptional regulator [Caballeronia sp. LP006]